MASCRAFAGEEKSKPDILSTDGHEFIFTEGRKGIPIVAGVSDPGTGLNDAGYI
jgi:hypothetical protein